MTKPFRCGGPIGSNEPIAPGKRLRTLFTPQTRFVVEGLQMLDGFKVVSVRRIPFTEVTIGGVVHGMACKPFTFKPRPATRVKHRLDDQRRLLLSGKGAEVCTSEALEMVVRNTTKKPLAFKAWWVGTTERVRY